MKKRAKSVIIEGMKVTIAEADGNVAVLSALKSIAKRGGEGEILVVVPDSYTLSFERELMKELGASFLLSVSTFRRLLSRLRRTDEKYLDAATGTMAVRAVVRNLGKELRAFGRSAKYASFSERMYELLSSLKNCGISPSDAAACGETLGGALGGKLSDVAKIYAGYEAAKADSKDSADLFALLPALIRGEEAFRTGTCVFAGFDIFTKLGEEVFLACAQNFSETVFVANTTDKPVFRPILLAEQISSLLSRRGIPFSRTRLGGNLSPFALAVSERLFEKRSVPRDPRADGAKFFVGSREEELEFAAREIKRLAMRGWRYGEFCIVLSNAAAYERALREVLTRHEIRYWYDRKSRLSEHPTARYLLCGLALRSRGYAQEDVLAFVKNPLFFSLSADLLPGEIDVFENYVLKYGIAGKRFFSEFTLAAPGDDALRSRAERVRHCFAQAAQMFFPGEDGDVLSKLLAFTDPATVTEQAWHRAFVEDSDPVFAAFSEQAPGYLYGILSSIRAVFGSPDEELLYDLFKSGVERQEVSEIPQRADCVFVGEKESVQYQSFRAVFVLGMNEGEFPTVTEDGGILNDRDADALARTGVRFTPKNSDNNLRMRFSVLKLLTNDYERRSFSATLDARPAETFRELIALCGGEISPLPEPAEMFSSERVRELYACREVRRAEAGEDGDYGAAAAICAHAERGDPFLWNLVREGIPPWTERISPNLAAELFYPRMKGERRTSISAVETYYRCPFRHFLRYGLKALERETAEIRALNIGNILHKALEYFVNGKDFSESAAEGCFDRTLALPEYEKYMAEESFRPVLSRLREESRKVCGAMARSFVQSEFENYACELGFGVCREGTPGMESIALSGTDVRLTGVIDRVDVYSLGESRVCRVVDYKTGAAEDVSEESLYFGHKVQLFVYLYALEKNLGCRPAGAYYFPVHNKYVKGEGNPYALRGVTLSEEEILVASDRALAESPESEILGVKRKPGGGGRGLISESRLRGYVEYAVKLCQSAIEESASGDIRILPAERACSHCPYLGVCRNFEGEGVRRVSNWSAESVSRALSEHAASPLADSPSAARSACGEEERE